MHSRSSFHAGSRVRLWMLGLAAFGGAVLLGVSGALALAQGSPFLESDNLFVSSICTAIALLFVALFLFAKETIHLPLNEPAGFLKIARRVLEDMGYEVTR